MTTAWGASHLVQLPIGMQVYPEGMSSQQADYACAEDASLSRTLAAVLSLPVCESASSIRNASSSESKFWPPKSFTDSGDSLSQFFCRTFAWQWSDALLQTLKILMHCQRRSTPPIFEGGHGSCSSNVIAIKSCPDLA